jgi:hypothetical protein
MCKSWNMGLNSFGCCSGMRSLFWCNNCMYICSYGSRRFGLLICLRSVMVLLTLNLRTTYMYVTLWGLQRAERHIYICRNKCDKFEAILFTPNLHTAELCFAVDSRRWGLRCVAIVAPPCPSTPPKSPSLKRKSLLQKFTRDFSVLMEVCAWVRAVFEDVWNILKMGTRASTISLGVITKVV